MRIQHDCALVNLSVLGEEARDVGFGETGVNAGHEQIGTRVLRAIVVLVVLSAAGSWRGWSTISSTAVGGHAPISVTDITHGARRSASVAFIALFIVIATILVLVIHGSHVDVGSLEGRRRWSRVVRAEVLIPSAVLPGWRELSKRC